jgi:hypothetical protein
VKNLPWMQNWWLYAIASEISIPPASHSYPTCWYGTKVNIVVYRKLLVQECVGASFVS